MALLADAPRIQECLVVQQNAFAVGEEICQAFVTRALSSLGVSDFDMFNDKVRSCASVLECCPSRVVHVRMKDLSVTRKRFCIIPGGGGVASALESQTPSLT